MRGLGPLSIQLHEFVLPVVHLATDVNTVSGDGVNVTAVGGDGVNDAMTFLSSSSSLALSFPPS